MKDIIKAMEAFNENLVGGKRLVKALEKDTVSRLFCFISVWRSCLILVIPANRNSKSLYSRGSIKEIWRIFSAEARLRKPAESQEPE